MLLDLLVHLEVCQFLHILSLVLVGHLYVLAIFDEIDLLLLSEVVSDGDECGHEALDIILETPLHIIVEVLVKVFDVSECECLPEHDLVEVLDEVALEEALVEEGLAEHPPYELEVAQVVHLHVRLRVRQVGRPRTRQDEQRIVRVEHLSRQLYEEVTSQTSCILTSLTRERNVQTALQLICCFVSYLSESIMQDVITSDVKLNRASIHIITSLHFVNLFLKV